MRLLRVFPRRTKATPTDAMAFVGEPPLFRPEADEVHVSVTFTWDMEEAGRLARSWARFYPVVKMGGPACDDRGGKFVPGRYLKPGYTMTSRGCPNRCPFCLVPEREGPIRELRPIAIGHDVQDNNLLACSDEHVGHVLAMLSARPRSARFSGGLQAERCTPAMVDRLRSVRISELFIGYDAATAWAAVQRAIGRFRQAGLRLRQVRCYVLAAFGEDTPTAAAARCEEVLAVGALPFMMLYQGPDEYIDYSREWRQLQRKWTRPAAMLARAQ